MFFLINIHLASREGKIDMAKLLLERGANIEAEDNNGCTSLILGKPKNIIS